jgi:hypothetical protein
MKRCEFAQGTAVHCKKLAAVTMHEAEVGDTLTKKVDVCAEHAEWLVLCNDGTQFADLERAKVEAWLWNVQVTEAEASELEWWEATRKDEKQ